MKFFKDCVKVDSISCESSQASVHFGREKYLGIKVVVKQYKEEAVSGLLREVNIYSKIEALRNEKLKQNSSRKETNQIKISDVAKQCTMHDGFPRLLAFKVTEDFGEILMVNEGKNLNYWAEKLQGIQQRTIFGLAMLN